MSQRNAAVQLNISQVENALRLWFGNIRERDSPVNGPLMQQKAESFILF